MKNKAYLSWKEDDFKKAGIDIPDCVKLGKTEGEIMEEEDIAEWLAEEIQTLSILKDEYPERFKEQLEGYLLDLEYLCSIGKITQEEKEDLSKKENINIEQ